MTSKETPRVKIMNVKRRLYSIFRERPEELTVDLKVKFDDVWHEAMASAWGDIADELEDIAELTNEEETEKRIRTLAGSVREVESVLVENIDKDE